MCAFIEVQSCRKRTGLAIYLAHNETLHLLWNTRLSGFSTSSLSLSGKQRSAIFAWPTFLRHVISMRVMLISMIVSLDLRVLCSMSICVLCFTVCCHCWQISTQATHHAFHTTDTINYTRPGLEECQRSVTVTGYADWGDI